MRPTPETDAERHDPTEIIIKSLRILASDIQSDDGVANLALLEAADCLERVARERDEAREELREWQTLRLWGGTPEHIHDFIKGQQSRIREVQDIEKTCEKLERELEDWENAAAHVEADNPDEVHCGCVPVLRKLLNDARKERDEAREELEEETKFHNRTHKELSKTKCQLMDAMQAIIDTLEENRYLADGDDCTLAKLKSVVPDWE